MSRHPSLYQINTRIWLAELASRLGRRATLDDVPDSALDQIADRGFDWVWLLGVWQTGPAGQAVSRGQPDWRKEFLHLLPDLKEADILGSPFAIRDYRVHSDHGGPEALRRLRQRFRERGLRLLLDFVPNHTALDHPWVFDHPEYYVPGDDADLVREPRNFHKVETRRGLRVLAHGRDPYFLGWPDTLQLNYRHPAVHAGMLAELLRVAEQCDGVRCDMAMLILPDVFERTWGQRAALEGVVPVFGSFWREAIPKVRERFPDFLLLAEVYWDLEWELQQQGFDYTYDKRLYDRLRSGDAGAVRGHLRAEDEFQRKSVRFLENHDEPRAAAVFPPGMHEAAACIAFLVPGMRFFHDGQLEGRRLSTSIHLGRRGAEPGDQHLVSFYARLLDCLREPLVQNGRWQLLDCRPSWNDNYSNHQFIAFSWDNASNNDEDRRLLVAVNYGPHRAQCYVTLPPVRLRGKRFLFRDLLGPDRYERHGDDLAHNGLFLDVPPWKAHVFEWTETHGLP